MQERDHTQNPAGRGPDDDRPQDDQMRADAARSNLSNDAVPLPSRLEAPAPDRRRGAVETDQNLIAEYEARYYGAGRLEDDPIEAEPVEPSFRVPSGRRPYLGRTKAKRTLAVNENERKWAALAHGSTLLTGLAALFSGGLLVLVTMFVPLFIYFSFRKRSEYVAFHALQAFTLQLVGTVGWLMLVLVGTLVSVALMIVAAILIVVLIGIVLLPLVIVTYILFLLASLALPLGMVIYSVIAMAETWSGHDYRIPYIARWVESQMYSDSPLSL